ncbi:MAG: sulfatase-like hydrolase/transferase [Planctomycetota bacterium]|jgi:arylsulfatase A-like enzyme
MNKYSYTRRDFLKTVGAGIAAMALPQMSIGADKAVRKPNFLFIFIDDMGYGDVGFNGNKFTETPNIDRIAREGMIFSNAYVNAPNCAPSRACLMSGQYTPRHGVYTVGPSERGESQHRKLIPIKNTVTLNPDIVTVAEALKPAGYINGHFGKWHLGKNKKQENGRSGDPGSQGFDEVLTTGGRKNNKTDAKHTKHLTDGAMLFMEKNKDKPFFCYVAHHTIHSPWLEEKELIAKYKAKPESKLPEFHPIVGAMIETLDKNVGRLMAKLEELKIADNTIVVFFSDNGGVLNYSSMGPLRGCKGTLYEGGIREPMAIRWPGKIKAGSVCDEPVMAVDFYPTFLELAGAPKPKQILDGMSIVPLLKGKKKLKRKAIFWHFPAYLQGNYGYPGRWRTTPAGAVRVGNWKLIEYFEDGRLELYNLKKDIGEKNNLAKENPKKTKKMHKLLRQWRESVKAPVPTELNPEYKPEA